MTPDKRKREDASEKSTAPRLPPPRSFRTPKQQTCTHAHAHDSLGTSTESPPPPPPWVPEADRLTAKGGSGPQPGPCSRAPRRRTLALCEEGPIPGPARTFPRPPAPAPTRRSEDARPGEGLAGTSREQGRRRVPLGLTEARPRCLPPPAGRSRSRAAPPARHPRSATAPSRSVGGYSRCSVSGGLRARG